MSTNKHPKSREGETPFRSDLERNPGIGASKGLFAREDIDDASLIEGENTFEGDTDNDAGRAGGVSLKEGRTND